eukprot:g20364.t1
MTRDEQPSPPPVPKAVLGVPASSRKTMQKPARRGAFALMCYLGAAATTTSTSSTLVSGFHTHTMTATGRSRSLAGGALRSYPRRLPQPRSLKVSTRGSAAKGGVVAMQQQHQHQQQRELGRGWRGGLGVVDASIRGNGVGGSGGAFVRHAACQRGERFVFRRAARGGTTASSRLRRHAAAGDDDEDDSNYGSPDYSEYGYEPEYELQGEDKFDADAETLAKWRLEKLLANDRWQFGKYGTQNVGNWIGSWQEFVAQEVAAGRGEDEESNVGSMIGMVPGKKFVASTKITRRVIESADNTKIFEHEQGPAAGGEGQGVVGYDSEACPRPVVDILFTDSFRGGNGTQVVGNAYTSADAHRPTAAAAAAAAGAGKGGRFDEQDVWIEVGLRAREKDVRMRCVFQYGPKVGEGDEGDSVAKGNEGVRAPSASASGSPGWMAIRRVFLVREGLDRLPLQDAAMEPELYGTAGKGLYDPSPLSRSPLYFSIYAEGGLTVRFPLEVEDGQGGVFSVDWTEGSSRYQADRVFSALDGTVLRLEVTEIGTEDAEVFLPMEKF